MFHHTVSANVATRHESPPSTLMPAKKTERVAKDDVTSAPVRNPYEALARASDRLSAGHSIFQHVDADKDNCKQPEIA